MWSIIRTGADIMNYTGIEEISKVLWEIAHMPKFPISHLGKFDTGLRAVFVTRRRIMVSIKAVQSAMLPEW